MPHKNHLLLTIGCAVLSAPLTGQKSERPNIVFIFPDQFRQSALGYWKEAPYKEHFPTQSDPVVTPHLDALARESVVFTSAVSNCPLSSPYRGMMLTGAYPDINGITLNCNSTRPKSSLNPSVKCISDILRANHYDCAYFGKLHADAPTANDPQRPGQYVENKRPVWDAYTPPERRHGFNHWYSYGTYDVHKAPHYWDNKGKRHEIKEWSPRHEADQVIAYIENKEKQFRDGDKPFLIMVGMNPPHHPYSSLDDVMEEDYLLYKDQTPEQLLVRDNADRNRNKAQEAAYYFAAVTGVDREIGRILKTLKEQGLDQNTIFVFTSDHGETMCSQYTDDPKNSPFSESFNVPLMIKYPPKIQPGIDKSLFCSVDFTPTLLGLVGLSDQIPSTVQGYNYAPYLTGENHPSDTPLKRALYIQNLDGEKDPQGLVQDYFPSARGIKTEQYTLVYYIDKKSRQISRTYFFDDLNDPYQLNNLPLSAHPSIVKKLNQELGSLLKETNDRWYKEKLLHHHLCY